MRSRTAAGVLAAGSRARAYWTLRSVHLERAHEFVDATFIFSKANYDFDESLTVGLDLVRATGPAAISRVLLRSRSLATVEINEPLGLDSLWWTVAAVAALRASARARRRRVRIVTYAIENDDPFARSGQSGAKARVRLALERRSARFIVKSLDRMAFGTDGARVVYERRFDGSLPALTRVVPALPTRCPCSGLSTKDQNQLLFLGAFSRRKGFDILLRIWPQISKRLPEARLLMIGKGSLEAEALDLATRDPNVRIIIDPPRETIHAALRESSALVLLSQRTPTWREQVGLPLVEALAHGCSVVTTTETGLTDWLNSHGHQVVPPESDDEVLIDAVVRTLEAPTHAADILGSLPSIDGRKAADAWLFSD